MLKTLLENTWIGWEKCDCTIFSSQKWSQLLDLPSLLFIWVWLTKLIAQGRVELVAQAACSSSSMLYSCVTSLLRVYSVKKIPLSGKERVRKRYFTTKFTTETWMTPAPQVPAAVSRRIPKRCISREQDQPTTVGAAEWLACARSKAPASAGCSRRARWGAACDAVN